jgi:hypothetical protein
VRSLLILFGAVLLWAAITTATVTWNSNADLKNPGKRNRKIISCSARQSSHANPKLKRWGISDSLRRFFADFDRFGVIVNGWATVKDSPWRLQELKDTKLRRFNNDHSKHGRRYDVFYIQRRVGSLEIADTSDYTTDQPRVRTNVLIREARLIPLDAVSRFLTAIGTLVSAGTGEEYAEARCNTRTCPAILVNRILLHGAAIFE